MIYLVQILKIYDTYLCYVNIIEVDGQPLLYLSYVILSYIPTMFFD